MILKIPPTLSLGHKMSSYVMFDIEASNLDGDWGAILCAVFKPEGEKPFVYRHDGAKSHGQVDVELVGGIKTQIEKHAQRADILVTWYGTMFDLRYVDTRLLLHQLPKLPSLFHLDLYYVAREVMQVSSRRLDSVAKAFALPVQKTPILPSVWLPALRGEKDAMDYVVKHCALDVEVLEQVFQRLKPHVKRIARRG